ncbi:hypothetical protein NDU88_000832 [Pleurodeles waltl]|uniref:Endonuclease domain-containing 1 protein n=1 Tax=Pleurodeles waltl TaxID=8319 RepID=A0AAV7SXT0_PLEWA|nr:hypothetical protein NDU88_000832 [Pleurodeles waltl]
MGFWVILALFLTSGEPAGAKVVDDFTHQCDGFFYKKTAPDGIPAVNPARICQQWHPFPDTNEPFLCFATLYDTFYRTPIWSAYYLMRNSRGAHQKIPPKWHIEPQLIANNLGGAMQKESEVPDDLLPSLKERQAINDDYGGSYFDRGHLFPNSFMETTLRDSTFTLTNAVPMDPCFNRVTWSRLEEQLKSQLLSNCVNVEGIPYLVTGSVPNQNRKIPVLDPEDTAPPGDPNDDYNRVSVPSHVWTAVCCDHQDENRKFSLAFLGENKAEGAIETLLVPDLEARLRDLYGSRNNIEVFSDLCQGADKERGVKISSEIKKKIVSGNILIDRALERKRAADNLAQRSSSAQKQVKTSSGTAYALQFPNYSEWNKFYNSEPGFICELSAPGRVGHTTTTLDHNEFFKRRKRDVAPETEGPVCLVQKEATLPTLAMGGQCLNDVCSNKDESYSWCWMDQKWEYCCTEKCEFNEEAKQYECQSSSYGKVPCSPQYSSVTAAGAACRSDHPCGKYGSTHYWCYIDYGETWQYCCSPKYPCGSSGQNLCAAADSGWKEIWCRM